MLSSGVPAEGCGRESGISLLNVSVSADLKRPASLQLGRLAALPPFRLIHTKQLAQLIQTLLLAYTRLYCSRPLGGR